MERDLLIYQIELERFNALSKQGAAFDELISRFPEEDVDIKNVLKSAYSKSNKVVIRHGLNFNTGEYEINAQTPQILDPEELNKLKTENPDLHKNIMPVYLHFLKEKAGR